MAVKVFIATRFNVAAVEGTGASVPVVCDQEWLERRFDLFERICLPSMVGQSDPDFTWFVFFSEHTPEAYRARITSIQERFHSFVPCYLPYGQKVFREYRKLVAGSLTKSDTHVITGRIDNDDAFHREMVSTLRSEFREQDFEFLNFTHGVQYDMKRGVVGQLGKHSNPFISLVERVQDGQVRTVLDVMHHQAAATGYLRNIETTPMWLQVIHTSNLANRFRPSRILFSPQLERDFNIKGPLNLSLFRSLLEELYCTRRGLIRIGRRLAKNALVRFSLAGKGV